MIVIKKSEISKYAVSGVFSTAGDMRPDKDSKEKKRINFEVVMDAVPVSGIIDKALSPVKISWVNNHRKDFDDLTDNQVVKVKFTAPSVEYRDPMEILLSEAEAEGVDTNDKAAMQAYMMERIYGKPAKGQDEVDGIEE